MPTYDYQCDACEHRFDLFQSMLDKPVRKCPNCGRLKVRRLLGTGGGIIFKGSGFYQTDYRSESYKAAAKADGDGTTKADSTAKPEAKPEPKADAKSESKTDTSKVKAKRKT
ncbi:MAG: FmdB family zinc ribbon protein [Planctomycetota bacterium]